MGLFDKLFRKPTQQIAANSYWQTLTAYSPAFRKWGGSIYESELVRSAINVRATHISKLAIDIQGTAQPKLRRRLKNSPNEWQTWESFLYRLSSILDVYNNAIIVPVYDELGEAVGIYPVLPSSCEVVSVKGEPYLRYTFQNGKRAAMEMSACGILTKHQLNDDIFGESNAALRPTMELIDLQNQAIREGVKSSATYRFVAQMDNFALDDDIVEQRKSFSRKNLSGEADNNGLLLFPTQFKNIKQIESKPYVPDAAQMQVIKTNIYNYFGVNEKILQSSANEDEMDAFFNGVIEPFSIQLSDVLTKMFFSSTEQTNGNRIYMISNRIQYMSVAHKIQLAQALGDRGALTIDDIRELFNYAPLPNGAGQFAPIRGEYYDVQEGKEGNEDGN